MKKYLVLLIGLTFRIYLATAQILVSPTITSITYNESDGKYIISWDNSKQTGVVDHFGLLVFYENSYKFINDNIPKQLTSIKIDSVITTTDNIKSFNLNHEVCYFAIEAYSAGGAAHSSDNISKGPATGAPSNLLLQDTFNLCSERLQLKWNTLNVWNSFIISYKYNLNPDSIFTDWSFSGGKTTKLNSFDIKKDAVYNKKYIPDTDIYIRIVAIDGAFNYWNSNIVKTNTRTILGPSYVNADGTNLLSNDSIQLNFTVDPASKLHKYRLLRADTSSSNTFHSIATIFDSTSHSIQYIDGNKVNASKTQYFYKLVALNNCDTPKIESNIESSIHLTVAQSTTTNDLSWNPYEQFAGKFKQYNIHRKRVGKGDIKLTSTSGLLYQDDLSTLEGKSISEEICYYVEAIEDSTTNPNSQIAGNAKSNISCVIVGTVIDIPKYFYNDGKHPPFRPKSSFLPVKYQFVIFDRWGTKIYETTDFASLGWNGRYSGGGAAPQSAYLYYVKMVGSDGKSLEQKGTFTLILP